MSKRAKIITSAVCIGLVVIGLAVTIILVAMKRFDITPNAEPTLNNHTEMIETGYDSFQYATVLATISDNATKIVKDGNEKVGVYSYISGSFVIPTTHKNITLIRNNVADGHAYYKTIDVIVGENIINLVDDKGKDIGIVEYNEQDNVNYSKIKQKYVNKVSSAGSVKATTKNKFTTEKIDINNVELMEVYYDQNKYWYETWRLVGKDGNIYENLYQIKNGKRELVQTLNNDIGLKPEEKNLTLAFCKDGTPRLINLENTNSFATYNKITVYDINFQKIGTAEINDYQAQYINKYFQIGNKMFVQCLIPTDSKKYDFQVTNGTDTLYYNLNTYQVNIKSASISKARFKYVITDVNTGFNNETALLKMVKIQGKKLDAESYYVVNERLQTQAIDYSFDTITQISKNHYIASNAGADYNIIGKNYKKIASLENFTTYFTTENAIILTNPTDNYAYVCNHDGVIVAKYLRTEIFNTYHKKYYAVRETVVDGSNTITSYYLENLGIREENPYRIIVGSQQINTFNDIEYAYTREVFQPSTSLIMRIKQEGSNYTYDIYTLQGKLLISLMNYSSSEYDIVEVYSDSKHSVVTFQGRYFTLDR